jgi:asparagine synthetase B (glutamine-hydrolysing)
MLSASQVFEKCFFSLAFQEGIDALEEVIYHVETYDVTTIRASTPMFLMSRKIKSLGVKMVLSGEGSDEIFGGYLYFHKAPNKEEFHEETCRKVSTLSTFPVFYFGGRSLCACKISGFFCITMLLFEVL